MTEVQRTGRTFPPPVGVLTHSHQLDDGNRKVLVVQVRVSALLVCGDGQAEQHQQRHHDQAEIDACCERQL